MKLKKVFNVEYETRKTIRYLRRYAEKNCKNSFNKYVIGMSGGKDSFVAAALAAKAVGPEHVTGLIMPNGTQKDINDAIECCEVLGIKYEIANIEELYNNLETLLDTVTKTEANYVSKTNDPACIRTLVLLALTRRIGGVMLNTCNRNEDLLGYSTFGGDSMGGVGPLCMYTVTEILAIGDYLGLPYHLVHKDPSDGMCGTTDEINLSKMLNIPNFTYERHSKLIRGEEHDFTDDEIKRMVALYNRMKFKIEIIRVKHQGVRMFDFFKKIPRKYLAQ